MATALRPSRTTYLKTDGFQLTPDNVREIRRLYATGLFTQEQLGNEFGVTGSAIGQAVRYVTYRYV